MEGSAFEPDFAGRISQNMTDMLIRGANRGRGQQRKGRERLEKLRMDWGCVKRGQQALRFKGRWSG